MKKVCFFTGTRADYGLLSSVMKEVEKDKNLKIQIVVTAMHLDKNFGYTYKVIEEDDFEIDYKIDNLMSNDSHVGVSKSAAIGLIGYTDALEKLNPDTIFILGDRFEIFMAAFAGFIKGIPICHYSGGEVTMGAYDDSLRHAITKFSKYHFVSEVEYKKRVIQLGEDPSNVFNVGSLGSELVRNFKPYSKNEVENKLNLKFLEKNILVTFHPETHEKISVHNQIDELLFALKSFNNINIIFTMPNFDKKSKIIIEKIENFCTLNKNAYTFQSLGQKLYHSTVKYVDAVVGNSSSGLTEVPHLKTFTINIGDRQKGRKKYNSVIDCALRKKDITSAIKKIYNSKISNTNFSVKSEQRDTSKIIISILKKINFTRNEPKLFHDVNFE